MLRIFWVGFKGCVQVLCVVCCLSPSPSPTPRGVTLSLHHGEVNTLQRRLAEDKEVLPCKVLVCLNHRFVTIHNKYKLTKLSQNVGHQLYAQYVKKYIYIAQNYIQRYSCKYQLLWGTVLSYLT